MQIIVLGPHRSGTSLVTRLINMMGAYCFAEGVSIGFNEENPKGFWERRDVIEANDELLASMNASWDRPASWGADLVAEEAKSKFQHRFREILLNLDANRPWVIKDPRLCLTLPLLKPLLEVPLLVYVSRSPLESATSLQTRNGLPLHYGLALWEFYAVSALNAGDGLPVIHVAYEEVLTRPLETVEALYDQMQESGVMGLNLPASREIEAFVDAGLWRERASVSDNEACLSRQQSLVYEMFQGKRPLKVPLEPAPVTMSALTATFLRNGLEKRPEPDESRMQEMRDRLQAMERERENLERHLEEVASERDTLRDQLQDVSKELASVRESFGRLQDDSRARRIELATLLTVLGEEHVRESPEPEQLKQVAATLGALQRQQQLLQQDLSQLENFLFELQRILRAIQSSLTWRQASRMAVWVGRMTGRQPSRIMEDAEQVFSAFEHWRKARS